MSKLNKLLGLSLVVAGAAFIRKIFGSNETDKSKATPEKRLDTNENNSGNKHEIQDKRTQKMFKDLSMTKNQKERYEASIREITDNWTKDNPNTPIDNKNLIDSEEKSLRAVLDEVQYGMYRDWAKKYEY